MPSFETRIRVRSYELDGLGHVNHAVYLNYLEQARYDAMEAGGFPHTAVLGRGWGIYVVRIEVDYRRQCFQGDHLRILTGVEHFRKVSMTIGQQIHRSGEGETDGEPAVTARVTLVWIDERGRPMRVPPEARRALGEPDGSLSAPARPIQKESR
ncbi:MAG: thioesterase family protein [Gemmatimonadota bacterium]